MIKIDNKNNFRQQDTVKDLSLPFQNAKEAKEIAQVESSDKETMSIVDTVSGLLFKRNIFSKQLNLLQNVFKVHISALSFDWKCFLKL